MSTQQRAALQAEMAMIEAMHEHTPFTVIGFVAGQLIAATENGWQAH